MIKISVIMPIYNEEKHLKKSLNSILNQTLSDIEIICIDDGSTDNSISILEKYKSKYSNITIISQKNQGAGKARNKGINIAKGKYIAFLDADDIYLDKFALEKMYKYALENNANVISGNSKLIKENYEIKRMKRSIFNNPIWDRYSNINPQEYGFPHLHFKNIYKRDFLVKNDIKFPNLLRGQDAVFLTNVLTKTKLIFTVPVTLYGYNYLNNGGSDNKINNYKKKYDYIKHYKLTLDLLKDSSLVNLYNNYKEGLFGFLAFGNNAYDKEYYQIYYEIFGFEDYNFNKTNKDYIRFQTLATTHILLNSKSEEFFYKIKEEFKYINLDKISLKDKLILKIKYKTFDELKNKIKIINESKSLDEFKIRYQNIFEINS